MLFFWAKVQPWISLPWHRRLDVIQLYAVTWPELSLRVIVLYASKHIALLLVMNIVEWFIFSVRFEVDTSITIRWSFRWQNRRRTGRNSLNKCSINDTKVIPIEIALVWYWLNTNASTEWPILAILECHSFLITCSDKVPLRTSCKLLGSYHWLR